MISNLKNRPLHRQLFIIGVIATVLLFCLSNLTRVSAINRFSLMLLKHHTESSPEQGPLFAIGVRPPNYATKYKLSFVENRAFETDIFNVHRGPIKTSLSNMSENIMTQLTNPHSSLPLDQGLLMKLARLELLAELYEKALNYLIQLENNTVCIQRDMQEADCYALWIAIGDALDGLNQPASALEYYQASSWLGRREAATFLALKLARQANLDGDKNQAKIWTDMATKISPNVLATLCDRHSESAALRSLDNPQVLLALGTDPRLERLNAEASVKLLQDRVWDKALFHRILSIRAWAVDTHLLDYHGYDELWVWTADTPDMAVQIDGLLAYFEQIVALVPQDGHAWYHLAELKARLGDCHEARSYYEQARKVKEPISDSLFKPFLRCNKKTAPTPNAPALKFMDVGAGRVVNMERWHSYGQAVHFSAAPSHQYGYERHAVWIWGPDTFYPKEGKTAFRADCLWHETSAEPTFLALTLTDEKGQIEYQTLPAHDGLELAYWWKMSPGVALIPRWFERIDSANHAVEVERNDVLRPDMDWHSTTLTIAPTNRARVLELRWYVTGCGQIWIDDIAGTRVVP